MIRFSAKELVDLAGTQLKGYEKLVEGDTRYSISTDTRSLNPDSVYLALSGEKFDGHDFVRNAFSGRTKICIVRDDKVESLLGTRQKDCALLPVPDTLAFYQKLAASARQRFTGKVIAVTGSSGKTTTKEMCASVFGALCHKSQANENNEIGVPKTILSMPTETRYLVIEMGMRGPGQIRELTEIAKPDIAIITVAGSAHIELLGSRENIAKAKAEIVGGLAPGGKLIVGELSDMLREEIRAAYAGDMADYDTAKVAVVDMDARGSTFVVDGLVEKFFVKAHGELLVRDAWCAVRAGIDAGLTEVQVAAGLAGYSAMEGRGNAVELDSGAIVIDESYNANPDSVRCAVLALTQSDAYTGKRKIVVLGRMAELGTYEEEMHRDLGVWLKDQPIDILVTVGGSAKLIADQCQSSPIEVHAMVDQDGAYETINERMCGNCVAMVKGSHSSNLDALVARLVKG